MNNQQKNERIQSLLSVMTLEEKASMLSGKNYWETQNWDKYGIKSIFLADGPSGLRKQEAAADRIGFNPSVPATCFPSASTLANSWDPEVAYAVGESLGEEACDNKVSVLLGPGINIKRDPRCGRNFEYYSEDPYLAGKLASGFVNGIQSRNVSACVKHFAANNQETRRMAIDSILDERALREIYLTAFEIVIKEAEANCLMTSYNRLNGEYANENELLYHILREEWNYKGVVVTDWGGGNDRVKGLECGNDLEMPSTNGESDREIIDAVKLGQISQELVDKSVARILDLVFSSLDSTADEDKYGLESHNKVALECAKKSMVLLKNDHNLLPIEDNRKVAVIGDYASNPRYQGAGSSNVNAYRIDNPLECLKESGLNVIGYEKGYERYGKKNKKLSKHAIELSKKADCVLLFLGLDELSEAEGVDRRDIKLPQNQIDLINELSLENIPLIAVLMCGSAIEMPFIDKLNSLLYVSLGGQAVGSAIATTITGANNPSGKLAESFPVTYSDCPCQGVFPSTERTAEYRESLFVGYRYYESASLPVLFPFGYGLSYTEFRYSDLVVTDKGIVFKLKNVGNHEGAEIAQLYIGKEHSGLIRPIKELKGFAKVFLKKGEEKTVEIPFDEYSFRYYNTTTGKWEIEEGEYTISVCASSAQIELCDSLFICGTNAPLPYDISLLPSYVKARKVEDIPSQEFSRLRGKRLPEEHFELDKKLRMTLGFNDTLSQLKYAKGAFARFCFCLIELVYKNSLKNNKPRANLIEMSIFNQPFRGIAKLTGGAISMNMIKGLLMIVNGRFWKGLDVFLKERKLLKKIPNKEWIGDISNERKEN